MCIESLDLMRLAGGKDVKSAFSGLFEEDANTGDLDKFMELFALLRSKGMGDKDAEHYAMQMLSGKEPEAQQSIRFAGVYGEQSDGSRPGV